MIRVSGAPPTARFAGALAVVLVVGALFAATALGGQATRSCGLVPFGIGWRVHATRNVACGTARRVISRYLHSRACAPGSCSVQGFRCGGGHAGDVAIIRCTRARQLVIGRGGP